MFAFHWNAGVANVLGIQTISNVALTAQRRLELSLQPGKTDQFPPERVGWTPCRQWRREPLTSDGHAKPHPEQARTVSVEMDG